jgi:hypothetical protein
LSRRVACKPREQFESVADENRAGFIGLQLPARVDFAAARDGEVVKVTVRLSLSRKMEYGNRGVAAADFGCDQVVDADEARNGCHILPTVRPIGDNPAAGRAA